MNYSLHLLSDSEIKAQSIINIINYNNNILEQSIFGTDIYNGICGTCFNDKSMCPSHIGHVEVPYPYLLPILKDIGRTIMACICKNCSRILLPNNELLNILKIPKIKRLSIIKEKVDALMSNTKLIICESCKATNYQFSLYNGCTKTNIFISDNNNIIIFPHNSQALFNNITQLDELGLNENFHPKKFWSNIIPIVGNKIRQKSIISESPAVLTYIYQMLLSDVLIKIKNYFDSYQYNLNNYNVLKNFYDIYYTMCEYVYMTFKAKYIKAETSFMLKNVSCLGVLDNLKGKDDTNIFMKGIISSRHDCSARSVLNGAPRAKIGELYLPYIVTNKLTTIYPIYKENIDTIKKLILEEKNLIHHKIIKIEYAHKKFWYIKETQMIDIIVNKLEPGHKLHIKLIPGDLVLTSRYPIVREESLSSFLVQEHEEKAFSLPLSVTEMKMADFDGDEIQVFVNYSKSAEIESILLNSHYAQLFNYKDGDFAIWPTKDALHGKKYLLENKENIKKILNVLPNDFYFKNSSLQINKKENLIKGNILDKEFYKYLGLSYGKYYILQLLDIIINLSYDVIKFKGISFGFEYLLPEDISTFIKHKNDERLTLMQKEECKNDILKDYIQLYKNSEKFKVDILEKVLHYLVNTPLSNFNMKKFEIQIYKALICIGQNTNKGNRILPSLNYNSRTIASYKRFSLSPLAYGYSPESYIEGKTPETEFYEQFESRDQAYVKGVGVAEQGYLAKQFNNFLGSIYAEYNGLLINNDTIVSLQYGSCGIKPRLNIIIDLPTLDTSNELYKNNENYILNKLKIQDLETINKSSQVKKILSNHLERRDNILSYIERYKNITLFILNDYEYKFITGFKYDSLIDMYISTQKNGYKNEVELLKDIESLLIEIENIYAPLDFIFREHIIKDIIYLEYYLFEELFSNKYYNKDLYNEIINQFSYSLVDAGDPVGIKASISMSEPLTQASLHSIHAHKTSSESAAVVRSTGANRFAELFGQSSQKYNNILLYINDNRYNEYILKEEACYIKDICYNSGLYLYIKIPDVLKEAYKELDLSNLSLGMYYIQLSLDVSYIATKHIKISTIINALLRNFAFISLIIPLLTYNNLLLYIFTKSNISDIKLLHNFLYIIQLEHTTTLLTGNMLKNCNVVESKMNKKKYLEANIFPPETADPKQAERTLSKYTKYLTHNKLINYYVTNNMDIECDLKGIFETQGILYEESIFTASKLSETNGILNRHYKLAAEMSTITGTINVAKPSDLKENHIIDPLRKIAFERPEEFIISALMNNSHVPINDPVSSQVFNEYAKLGTGVSEIIFKF